MSDQQRMLLAAVLMAVVLFASWTLSDRGGGGEEGRTTAPAPTPAVADGRPAPPDTTTAMPSPAPDTTRIVSDSLPEGAGEGAVRVVVMDGEGADTLVSARIDLMGGGIAEWRLHRFRDLTDGTGPRIDLGAAGLLQAAGEEGPVPFVCEGPDTLVVASGDAPLVLEGPGGGRREYTFHAGSYAFDVTQEGLTSGLDVPAGAIPVTEEGAKPEDYFKTVWMRAGDLEDNKAGDLEGSTERDEVDWGGVRSKYFTILLINTEEREDIIFAPHEGESPSASMQVASAKVYAGPVGYERLQALAIGAEHMVDFGWPIIRWIGRIIFWFISVPLAFVGNWGVRIILLTMVLKTLLWPLTTKSFTSMQKMKEVQPRLKELQEKYKSDPKRQQMEMQKLYREEGVNPLGGCFPLLLQMPFFFAMYRVLSNLVELRGAGFVLWIDDLSRPEILIPFGGSILGLEGIGLLALLMGVSMFIQQKMSVSDPSQKTMVYVMPIFMTWLFMRFPAGLTLYWFVNNLLTIGQQELIKKRLEKASG
jgi:YidC/Oxa1 family membrane protein insertase